MIGEEGAQGRDHSLHIIGKQCALGERFITYDSGGEYTGEPFISYDRGGGCKGDHSSYIIGEEGAQGAPFIIYDRGSNKYDVYMF